jgi:hypothetical protein
MFFCVRASCDATYSNLTYVYPARRTVTHSSRGADACIAVRNGEPFCLLRIDLRKCLPPRLTREQRRGKADRSSNGDVDRHAGS